MPERRTRTIAGLIAVAIMAGMIGAAIANGLFGSVTRGVGPIEVELSAAPSLDGRSVISVPPLGRLEASTHSAPIVITAVVEEAKAEELRSLLISRPDSRELVREIERDARLAVTALIKRILFLGFVGGAIAAFFVLPRRRIISSAIGGVTGLVVAGTLMAVTFVSYEHDAFRDPSYHGAIKSAPWVVRLAQDSFESLEDLTSEMRITAENVLRLQDQLNAIGSLRNPEAEVRILVISDLHNNVLAVNYLADLARLFDVHFVLNAGDLTDFGTPFEDELARQLEHIGRPHVFVAGNHDSPNTVRALSKLKGFYLPHEKVVELEGIRILGQHDPASLKPGIERELMASSAELSHSASRLESVLRRQRKKPDIIMVHTPEIARHFVGKAPILVSGHVHRMSVQQGDNTIWINPGSSGAAGIRYFQGENEKAITAVILYVNRKPQVEAVAADLISITSPKGEFVIERKKF